MAVKKVSWQLRPKAEMNSLIGQADEDRPYQFDTILSPYFRAAGSHCIGLDEPFIANFYYQGYFPSHKTEVNVRGLEVESTFWDKSSMPREGRVSNYEENSSNVKILYNNSMAGVLCIETQTLWASDWTHDRSFRCATKQIIDTLVEMGLLKPVSEYQEGLKKTKEPEKITYPEYAITMGCDPEFEVVEDGRVKQATARLGRKFDFTHPEFGNFGLDGAGDQVELRPSPGEPETVVKNIRGLLGLFGTESRGKYTIAPSSDRFPCGGHIHIGVKPKPPMYFFDELTKILDDFIGRPTRGLNGERRGSSGSYGRISDWSEQAHGMEYRTPPGTIFRSPELSRVVLQLGFNLSYMFANAREIEYGPVSLETLMSVGGLNREDAEFYLSECQKPAPHSDECLLAAWGVEVEKPKPRITVSFGEDWSAGVKNFVNTFLENIEPTRSMGLYFFGLREERGNVYTFKVKRRGMVLNHPSVVRHSNSFGFSRKFRDGGESPEKMLQIMNTLLKNLGIQIKEV